MRIGAPSITQVLPLLSVTVGLVAVCVTTNTRRSVAPVVSTAADVVLAVLPPVKTWLTTAGIEDSTPWYAVRERIAPWLTTGVQATV